MRETVVAPVVGVRNCQGNNPRSPTFGTDGWGSAIRIADSSGDVIVSSLVNFAV